jgi:hypothetical protein
MNITSEDPNTALSTYIKIPRIIVFKMTQLRQATREEMIMIPYTKSRNMKFHIKILCLLIDITSNEFK